MAQNKVGIVGKVILTAIAFAIVTGICACIINVVAGAGFNVIIPWWDAVRYGVIVSVICLVVVWCFGVFD